jgi:hypothetical protein
MSAAAGTADVLGRLLIARSAKNTAVPSQHPNLAFAQLKASMGIHALDWHSLWFGASRCRKPTEDVGGPGGGAPIRARFRISDEEP